MKCLPLIQLPLYLSNGFGLPKAFQEADVLIQVWPDACARYAQNLHISTIPHHSYMPIKET
jgi:hypothetical protein